MNQRTYQQRKREIKQAWADDAGRAYSVATELIMDLWHEKDYTHIVDLYLWPLVTPKAPLHLFEVAYSLAQCQYAADAERVYESLLLGDPDNSSVLNNLCLLKRGKGAIEQAWELIQRAKQIAPKDEIIERNFSDLRSIIDERRALDAQYRASADRVCKENDFVIAKLRFFLTRAKSDPECRGLIIPIPRWKFKVLIGTDEQKAESLVEQWLEKGYIRRTGERGEHGEHIYQINPHLEDGLRTSDKAKERTRVPGAWVEGMGTLDADHLQALGYYEAVDRLTKVKRAFRTLLERDLNETFLNYLMHNNKSVIVLSGSLVETLLIYHCEKKKITEVSYQRGQRVVKKRLYDADLGDLLDFFEQQGMLGDLLVHMGNISRISRNFIHPGKELRESEQLSQAKADMCFLSAMEIIRQIC